MRGSCVSAPGISMHLRNSAILIGVLTLVGCATSPPPAPAPAAPPAPGDAQHCLSRAECTTKVARTLLFVFDYAAAGGALVERRGPLLFTPPNAPPSDWPSLRIRLAEPVNGRFDFASQCRSRTCRYSDAELRQIYRRYLDGEPCVLPLPPQATRDCATPAHRDLSR